MLCCSLRLRMIFPKCSGRSGSTRNARCTSTQAGWVDQRERVLSSSDERKKSVSKVTSSSQKGFYHIKVLLKMFDSHWWYQSCRARLLPLLVRCHPGHFDH